MPVEEIAGHATITLFIHAIEKLRRVRFVKCRIAGRNRDIRVSFACLLAVQDGAKFVLIRSLRRPEAFAPLGGVVKYHVEAAEELDALEFRPEDSGPGDIMKHDLRGYLPRKYLPGMAKWFDQREDHESAAECIARELREELREIALDLPIPDHVRIRRIRSVFEGPEKVPARSYTQFRSIDVYALAPSRESEEFVAFLIAAARTHKDLILANAEELIEGRTTDGRLIAHTAAYLVQRRRVHPDLPAFAHLPGTP